MILFDMKHKLANIYQNDEVHNHKVNFNLNDSLNIEHKKDSSNTNINTQEELYDLEAEKSQESSISEIIDELSDDSKSFSEVCIFKYFSYTLHLKNFVNHGFKDNSTSSLKPTNSVCQKKIKMYSF